jgi:hypothetical protein
LWKTVSYASSVAADGISLEQGLQSGYCTMWSYRICGYTFLSNTPIPELTLVGELEPAFTFQLFAATKDFAESYHWLNHWYSPDGTIWLAFAKVDAGYLLRFPEIADFIVSTDARSICCYPRAEIPLETIRHLLLNQVIPLVLSHLGRIVLHAAACAMPQAAIAFMGSTGAGKSTLAASFGLKGFPILTDDCLLIEEQEGVVVSVPSYPGLRLWSESISALFEEEPVLQPVAHYTEKKRLLVEQDQFNGPTLLSAIYVLTEPEDSEEFTGVTITPLAESEAIFEAIKHTFQLDISDRAKLRRDFKQYEWLAKSVPFFKLAFPREHACLSSVNRAILDHLNVIQKLQQSKAVMD